MEAYAYARQLKQLLPRGILWALESDSELSKLLLGIADELVRVDGRGVALLEEWDPRTADETLADWERALGLIPADGATAAARRLQAAMKLVARGGQTSAYFKALAERLGFTVSIAQTDDYVWTMTVTVGTAPFAVRTQDFRAGIARAGDTLQSWTIPELEDEINRAKPAHTRALFAYE